MTKSHILIVEDGETLADMLYEALTHADFGGYDVKICGTAEEALDLLKVEAFDLLLIDYHLPGVDGLAFLQQAALLGCDAGKILMTVCESAQIERRASTLANDFFLKPFDLQQLLHSIESILADRRDSEPKASQDQKEGEAC